jgi:hypothetical protein
MVMEMLPESRPIHIKTKQTGKDICISNSKKRLRQHQKSLKIGLLKNKRSCSSLDPFSAESIEEISRRMEDSYVNSSFLDRLIKKAKYFNYSTGEIRKCVNQRASFTMKTKESIL